jgi:hypothetical protein
MFVRTKGCPGRRYPATKLPPRDNVAELLGQEAGTEVFSAARTAPVNDLRLEVRGVGPIELPVSEEQALRLCEIARPARYGRGEETLVDRAVRDTWEIPKSRVRIDKRRFDRTLVPLVERLSQDLGFPAGCRLRAELHSVLVYAPGQFFVQHQDSEKDDTMVASLVVCLPSTFTGGALEVHHDGRIATYRGSKKALSFVAFYCDCRHQIKPVRSGHRVVLTYNLLLHEHAGGSTVDTDPALTGELARHVEEHFAPSDAPNRLVYLLDHEYTARGLNWSRLKGVDARSAALLRGAAEQAGCEATLGLVDVHETWDAYEVERRWGRSRWRRWDDWDDDDDEHSIGGPGEDYELGELIEREVSLEALLDPAESRLEEVRLPLRDDEVCESVSSDELQPYSSEYEGYMGNWGNTLDRWYHRGAVVVWPRTRAFAVRAQSFPTWALESLAAQVRAGDLVGAREAAATLTDFWDKVAGSVQSKGFFTKALRAARLLDDPLLASMLLRPFRLETLTASHAKPFSSLVEHYGQGWASELVSGWSTHRFGYGLAGPNRGAWVASLARLTVAFQKTGDAGVTSVRLLLEDSWRWASKSIDSGLAQPSPSRRSHSLGELARPVAAIVESVRLIDDRELRERVVASLCRENEDLVRLAIAVLRTTPRSTHKAAGLDQVAAHCSSVLRSRLALPTRPAGDWSVRLPDGCRCDLCRTLETFLADPSRTSFEWPLAKDRRAHVHNRIDTAELPVTHRTTRTGRPYTLVLTKTEALFDLENRRRERDQADLEWLRCSSA